MLVDVVCIVAFLHTGTSGEEEAKMIRSIVQEIDRSPSLYRRFELPTDVVAAPKSVLAKLMAVAVDERESFDKERVRRNAGKEKYDAAHSVRAAVFAAVEASQETQRRTLRLELSAVPITPKLKAAIAKDQADIAAAIFHLEQVLDEMIEAEKGIDKEPRKHWQAQYHWARSQLQADMIFLMEYNFALGAIRADRLPELDKGDVGWKIMFVLRPRAPEAKVKALAKDRAKRLSLLEKDYADTPWAHFAAREGERWIGMEWMTRKK